MEPVDPSGGSRSRLPNVFLTPHIAGSMAEEIRRMGEYMKEEYQAKQLPPDVPPVLRSRKKCWRQWPDDA